MFGWLYTLQCVCCAPCDPPAFRYYRAGYAWNDEDHVCGSPASPPIYIREDALEPTDLLKVGGDCHMVVANYGFPWSHRLMTGAGVDHVTDPFTVDVNPNGLYRLVQHITINGRVCYIYPAYKVESIPDVYRAVEYLIYWNPSGTPGSGGEGSWVVERYASLTTLEGSLYPGSLVLHPPEQLDIARDPDMQNVLWQLPHPGSNNQQQLPSGSGGGGGWEAVEGDPVELPGVAEDWTDLTIPGAIINNTPDPAAAAGCGNGEYVGVGVGGIENAVPQCCRAYRWTHVDGLDYETTLYKWYIEHINFSWFRGTQDCNGGSLVAADPDAPPIVRTYMRGGALANIFDCDPDEFGGLRVTDATPSMQYQRDPRTGKITGVDIVGDVNLGFDGGPEVIFHWEGSVDPGTAVKNQMTDPVVCPTLQDCEVEGVPCEEDPYPWAGYAGTATVGGKSAVGEMISWIAPLYILGYDLLTAGGVTRPEQAVRSDNDGGRGETFTGTEENPWPAFNAVVNVGSYGAALLNLWVENGGAIWATQGTSDVLWKAGTGLTTVAASSAATGSFDVAGAGPGVPRILFFDYNAGTDIGLVELPNCDGVNQLGTMGYGSVAVAATGGTHAAHGVAYDGVSGPQMAWSTNLAMGYAFMVLGTPGGVGDGLYIRHGNFGGKRRFAQLASGGGDWHISFITDRWVIGNGVTNYELENTDDLPPVEQRFGFGGPVLRWPDQQANAVATSGGMITIVTTLASGRSVFILDAGTGEVIAAGDVGYIQQGSSSLGLTACAFAAEGDGSYLYVGGTVIDDGCTRRMVWKFDLAAIEDGELTGLLWGTAPQGASGSVRHLYATGSAGSGAESDGLCIAAIPNSPNRLYAFQAFSKAIAWKVYQY